VANTFPVAFGTVGKAEASYVKVKFAPLVK